LRPRRATITGRTRRRLAAMAGGRAAKKYGKLDAELAMAVTAHRSLLLSGLFAPPEPPYGGSSPNSGSAPFAGFGA
jgi:hypothetical protein